MKTFENNENAESVKDLFIVKMSQYSASVSGETEIILLCKEVSEEGIQIRFFEEDNGEVIWEGMGDFTTSDVHKQTAITFRTPSYKDLDIKNPVKVFVELKRPSDGATSKPVEFEMLPLAQKCRMDHKCCMYYSSVSSGENNFQNNNN